MWFLEVANENVGVRHVVLKVAKGLIYKQCGVLCVGFR